MQKTNPNRLPFTPPPSHRCNAAYGPFSLILVHQLAVGSELQTSVDLRDDLSHLLGQFLI